jgi:hypothetical protein
MHGAHPSYPQGLIREIIALDDHAIFPMSIQRIDNSSVYIDKHHFEPGSREDLPHKRPPDIPRAKHHKLFVQGQVPHEDVTVPQMTQPDNSICPNWRQQK